MDTKVNMDESGVTENMSCDAIKTLDKSCAGMEAISPSSPPSMLDNGGVSLSPMTPYSDKEIVDLTSNLASPLTVASSLHQSGYDCSMNEDDDSDSPCTPKEGAFDPFAPGPDKLMLAPRCMKFLENSQCDVVRRLNFNSVATNEGVSETGFDDNALMEAVYKTLLDAIVSKQAEDVLADVSGPDSSPDVLLMTPPSAPRLTGVAETCPGAPSRPVRKSRNIDLSLCRALEFDFEV